MRKFLLLFILLATSLGANALYYNNLWYSTSGDECTLMGYDPDYIVPSSVNLIIPEYAYNEAGNKYKVTAIASSAFKGHAEIENLYVPATVEVIGAEAFSSCISLKECILALATKEIGNKAFFGCISLVALSTNAEQIGSEAFAGCIALSAAYLGAPMKYIEPGAFMGCTALTNIDIPHTVERIGGLPGYVTHIGAFEDCLSLMAVTFSYNLSDKKPCLRRIDNNTFKNCINLQRLDFPYGVTNIGSDAFLRCTSLKHLEWGGPQEISVGRIDFTGVPLSRIVYHGNVRLSDASDFQKLEFLKEVRYDTYATEVQSGIYKNLSTLKEVHLDNVTKINSSAFMNCTGLKELALSPELEIIDHYAFSNCISLEKVEMPANLTSIKSEVFAGCRKLREIYLNENLKNIGSNAFKGCHALNILTIPMSVNNISSNALDSCQKLRYITLGGPEILNLGSNFAAQSPIESIMLRGNVNAKFSHLKTLDSVYRTKYCNTYYPYQFANCPDLSNVNFYNIKSIGQAAFYNCTALDAIDLETVEEIGNQAFNNCTNLASVKFGDKITKIPDCLSKSGITALNIPDNVTSFTTPGNCESLATVTIGDGVTQCNGGFTGCTSLQSVRFGKNTTAVYLQPKSVRKIISANPVPPKASNFQKEVYDLSELIVPIGAADAYRNAQYWKNFYKITEVDMAGVEDILADKDTPEIEAGNGYIDIQSPYTTFVYSIDGRLVEALQPGKHHVDLRHGMYILVSGNFSHKVCL